MRLVLRFPSTSSHVAVTYRPTTDGITVKQALFQMCKEFDLGSPTQPLTCCLIVVVTIVLTDVSLCTLASVTLNRPGEILPLGSVLASVVSLSDTLIIYAHPFLTTILTEDVNGRELPPFRLILDKKMPTSYSSLPFFVSPD